MHPDDMLVHFKSVYAILKDDGRYIFSTPHKASGPHDVSRVFRSNELMGMHLKEYTYAELKSLLRQAGFEAYGVLKLPAKVRRLLCDAKPVVSQGYLKYLRVVENILGSIQPYNIRSKVVSASKVLLYTPNIMIVALKR
jgi:hypothetical protein